MKYYTVYCIFYKLNEQCRVHTYLIEKKKSIIYLSKIFKLMTCLKKQIKTHKFIQTGKDLFILATYKKSTLKYKKGSSVP